MSKTELDLDAIEARAEAATPGPWLRDERTVWAPTDDGKQNRFWASVSSSPHACGLEEKLATAAFIAAARTDVPALVRELREARRVIRDRGIYCGPDESAFDLAQAEAAEERRHADEAIKRAAGLRARAEEAEAMLSRRADEWAAERARWKDATVAESPEEAASDIEKLEARAEAAEKERDEARRERDEAKRTVAAASRYMFGRDEAIARAERSEAELEQLRVMAAACVARESRQSPADDSLRAALAASEKRRAELESAWSTAVGWHSQGTAALARAERAERAEAACAQMRAVIENVRAHRYSAREVDAALTTDVGAGYVSPEQHAEEVGALEALRADASERALKAESALDVAWQATGVASTVRGLTTLDDVIAVDRAKLAEVTAQAAVMREALEFVARYPMTRDSHRWAEVEISKVADALATDAGAGYVSPEQHAEVVAQLATAANECDDLRAKLAEVTAQLAVMREAVIFARESYDGYGYHTAKLDAVLATDVGKALAERVKLLEAVVVGAHGTFDGNFAALRDALAALDAHDKQHGG